MKYLPYCIAAGISVLQIPAAYITTAMGCDRGQPAYYITGAISLLICAMMPFIPKEKNKTFKIVLCVVFAFVSAAIWTVGYIIAGHSLLCEYFILPLPSAAQSPR